jgi:hypothetical protein
MTDEKTPAPAAVPVQDKPVFAIGVLVVEIKNAVWITESRAGFLEADSVLAQIIFCLAGIPFKAHDRSPST